jgi:hypothetical protein
MELQYDSKQTDIGVSVVKQRLLGEYISPVSDGKFALSEQDMIFVILIGQTSFAGSCNPKLEHSAL